MNLSEIEIRKFYKLWYALVWGVNERHKVIPHFRKPKYGTQVSVSIEKFAEVRDAMWDNPGWIDEILAENNNEEFTEQERAIIMEWRKHFVKGDFLVVKHLSKYTVLMTFDDEPVYLYGVHGISDPLKNILPQPVPFPINTVLVPWGDKIIFDSLIFSSNVSFGTGARSSVKEWYASSKEKYGIIERFKEGGPVERVSKDR